MGFESFTGGRWEVVGVGVRVREGEQIKLIGSGREAGVGGRGGLGRRVVLRVDIWVLRRRRRRGGSVKI